MTKSKVGAGGRRLTHELVHVSFVVEIHLKDLDGRAGRGRTVEGGEVASPRRRANRHRRRAGGGRAVEGRVFGLDGGDAAVFLRRYPVRAVKARPRDGPEGWRPG